jgi:hypothetical protein
MTRAGRYTIQESWASGGPEAPHEVRGVGMITSLTTREFQANGGTEAPVVLGIGMAVSQQREDALIDSTRRRIGSKQS